MEADLLLIKRAANTIHPKPITVHTLGEAIKTMGEIPPAPGIITNYLQTSLGYIHHVNGTFYHWMSAPDNAVTSGDTIADRIEKIIISGTHAGVTSARIQLTEAVNAVRESGVHVTWKDITRVLGEMGWTRLGKRFIPGAGLKIVFEKTSSPQRTSAPRKSREEKLRELIESLGVDTFRTADLAPGIASRGLKFNDDLIATISSLGGWERVGTSMQFARRVEGID